jgi:hypothetical protein
MLMVQSYANGFPRSPSKIGSNGDEFTGSQLESDSHTVQLRFLQFKGNQKRWRWKSSLDNAHGIDEFALSYCRRENSHYHNQETSRPHFESPSVVKTDQCPPDAISMHET